MQQMMIKKEPILKKFITLEKNEKIAYDNIYLDEYKIVMSTSISDKEIDGNQFVFEKFTFENRCFVSY